MASVEEIYRKIRNGDMTGIKTIRVSDADLEAGVERIRARLSGDAPVQMPTVRQRDFSARRWLWAPAAFALATLLVIVLFRAPAADRWVRGDQLLALEQSFTLGSGESIALGERISVKALRPSQIVLLPRTGEIRHIYVQSGMVLAERSDHTLPVTLRTNHRVFVFAGTRFVCEVSAAGEKIFMLSGKIDFQNGERLQSISAAGHNAFVATGGKIDLKRQDRTEFIKSYPELLKELGGVAEFHNIQLPKPRVALRQDAAKFRAGQCVFYFRNNEKRRGKIYAEERAGQGYVIHGASGPEPGRYSDADIFTRGCDD